MPSPTVATASVAATKVVEVTPETTPYTDKKSATNWSAFDKAHLVPTTVKCDFYSIPGQNTQDLSCHNNLLLNAQAVKDHIDKDHGAKFRFMLRLSDGTTKASAIWEDLAKLGLEASDFRCEVCNEKLRFHPASFARHLKPHQGKVRQAYADLHRSNPKAVGFFDITIGTAVTDEFLEDSEEFDN